MYIQNPVWWGLSYTLILPQMTGHHHLRWSWLWMIIDSVATSETISFVHTQKIHISDCSIGFQCLTELFCVCSINTVGFSIIYHWRTRNKSVTILKNECNHISWSEVNEELDAIKSETASRLSPVPRFAVCKAWSCFWMEARINNDQNNRLNPRVWCLCYSSISHKAFLFPLI